MRKLMLTILLAGGMAAFMPVAAQERHPEYLQAEKFTGSKLKNMLFSTKVDPHWFQKETVSGLSIKRVKELSGMSLILLHVQRNYF